MAISGYRQRNWCGCSSCSRHELDNRLGTDCYRTTNRSIRANENRAWCCVSQIFLCYLIIVLNDHKFQSIRIDYCAIVIFIAAADHYSSQLALESSLPSCYIREESTAGITFRIRENQQNRFSTV